MIQAAKIIGTKLTTTGLIDAGVGIGVVFGALILGVSRDTSLLGQFLYHGILAFDFTNAAGLLEIIIGIVVSLLLICLIYNLVLRSSFNLQLFLLPIGIILLLIFAFLFIGLLFTLEIELISYIKVFHKLYIGSRYIYMASPGGDPDDVFRARAKDRVTGILFNKICEKHNVTLHLKIYIQDYFRYFWLNKYNRLNRIWPHWDQ